MTTTTDAHTEWQLPIEKLLGIHRERIDGHEDQVPAMVEAWFIGDHSPAWMTWVGDTGDIPTRDAGLHAVDIMAACGADFIVFSFDTHMTSLPMNPKTNKPWGPGEMQAMCDEEGFCDTGQMRDNLVVAIVRRSDLKLYFHSIAYHFHKGELQFFPETHMSEWEDEGEPGHGKMTGTIPNRMREAMTRRTSTELLKRIGISAEDLGFKPEDARIVRLHTILAGMRILNTLARAEGLPQMYACAIPTLSEEEALIVQETANRSGLEVRGVS